MDRLLSNLQTLFEGIVIDHPDQRISKLALLTTRRSGTNSWSPGTSSAQDYPRDKCIHELFEGKREKLQNRSR
jgi:hypothetical protein